jgi:hypothetical protein
MDLINLDQIADEWADNTPNSGGMNLYKFSELKRRQATKRVLPAVSGNFRG